MNTSFSNELQQLQMELRAQNFDVIRFSTYRTACKLRFIQKKLNLHLLDLLNVVESLRESSTNSYCETNLNRFNPGSSRTPTLMSCPLFDSNQYLSINQLTILLTSIYSNLNKRLPLFRQIAHVDKCVQSAIAWMLHVYNSDQNTVRLSAFRVVLILLCSGKLIDKMRHLFASNLSTASLHKLTYGQIDEFLREILALPYALQEISYATYSKSYARSIFAQLSSSITLEEFLDLLIYNNKSPVGLQWLVLFHRLISVENVIHRVKCSACERPSFSGFRYKCQQCHHRSYQLCQDCFWRGRTSEQHLSTHEMKEYTYFLPQRKDFRHSIRKSLRCLPKSEKHHPCLNSLTVDKEEPLPLKDTSRTNKSMLTTNDEIDVTKRATAERKQVYSVNQRLESVDEKEKINSTGNQIQTKFHSNQHHSPRKYAMHQSTDKKLMISKLEAENRRIVREINTLRTKIKNRSLTHMDGDDYPVYNDRNLLSPTDEQRYSKTLPSHRSHADRKSTSYPSNPLMHRMRRAGSVETANKNPYSERDLGVLLKRKHQLEHRIYQLHKSREELTSQLDQLSRNLRHSSHLPRQRITSSSHDRSRIASANVNYQTRASNEAALRSYSTPTTPVHARLTNDLRTDLLLAADSLTSAMSSLVQQLNISTGSYGTVLQAGNEFNSYSYDSDNRTDDDSFVLSDEDNF